VAKKGKTAGGWDADGRGGPGTGAKVMALTALAVLLLTAVLLGGCWDKREAEEQGYVRATVVDRAPEGGVRVLAQVPNPRALGGGATGGLTPGVSVPSMPYRNYAADGATVFEAIRQMARGSPRRLFWGQNEMVVFTERMADGGLSEHLDFFERSVEIRRRLVNIFVTPSDPVALMSIIGTQEPSPAGRIERITDTQDMSGRYAVISLSEFFRMLAREGQDPFCGVLRVRRNPAAAGSILPVEGPVSERIIELSGAAAFRGDRLAGYLTEKETRGLLWVQNRFRGGAVTFPSPSGDGRITVEVNGGRARITPAIEDGRLLATVEVTGVEGLLAESQPQLAINQAETIQALNRALERAIESDVMAAANKAQALGADVLGVGMAFHREFPREWHASLKEDWRDIFPTVEISARAEAQIRRTGLSVRGLRITN